MVTAMSKNKSLSDLFIDELQDMYDAENRIVKALPKLVKAATSADLKEAFESHLEETRGHVEKLEKVFKSIGEKAKAKECKATVGLLKEGDEIAADFKGSSAINAALISAGQKVEHYEIASYGCLIEWAEALDHSTAAELLGQILDEEKAADEKLTSLAREGANDEALETADDGETLEKSKRK
jgi:ferritin-like metal-binding protein YciE